MIGRPTTPPERAALLARRDDIPLERAAALRGPEWLADLRAIRAARFPSDLIGRVPRA